MEKPFLHDTVNCLFFVIEKFSSLRLLTKIFHPKLFLTLNFSSQKNKKRNIDENFSQRKLKKKRNLSERKISELRYSDSSIVIHAAGYTGDYKLTGAKMNKQTQLYKHGQSVYIFTTWLLYYTIKATVEDTECQEYIARINLTYYRWCTTDGVPTQLDIPVMV